MAGLGETLREARLRRNLTLEAAERATKVRKLFLAALEAERFDLLPARVYAQGFLQIYARYLGVDPKPLLSLLPPEALPVLPGRLHQRRAPERFLWTVPMAILLGAALAGLYFYQQAATAAPSSERLLAQPPTATATPPPPRPTATIALVAPDATSQKLVLTPTATPPLPTATPVVSLVSVVGRPLAQAVQTLQGLGFRVITEERPNQDVPQGLVVGQIPAAGAALQQSASVTIIVSKGPEGLVVPNVVGKSEAEARTQLGTAGLRAAPYANYQGHADLPVELLRQVCVGCVLSSTPQPGATVALGAQVYLAVRKE